MLISELKKDCIFILLFCFQAVCHKMTEEKVKKDCFHINWKKHLSQTLFRHLAQWIFFLWQEKAQKKLSIIMVQRKENCHIATSIPSDSVRTFMGSMVQNKYTSQNSHTCSNVMFLKLDNNSLFHNWNYNTVPINKARFNFLYTSKKQRTQ